MDPDADPPAHPRWFALDEREVRERAAREPFPLTWVAETDDLEEAVARVPELGAIHGLTRGALERRIALPEGGGLLFDGVMPAMIQWLGGTHPCDRLEDRGFELALVGLRHPAASDVAMMLQVLEFEGWDAVETGPSRLALTIRGPLGAVSL